MKKILYTLALAVTLWSCKTGNSSGAAKSNVVEVNINLIDVKDDRVLVTVTPPQIKTDEIIYSIPKTVPGTYSTDNYGKNSDDFKAFDAKGNPLTVKRIDDNSWSISNAKALKKITYLVADTFDTEKGTGFGNDDIFSPAGTNINAGVNFMINTHGFVGYFQDKLNIPYKVTITHPDTLWGATSMTDEDASNTSDVFTTSRYAVLVENPIMYSKPDYTTFNVNGMDILIAVYSPTGKFTAESITPEMKTIMTAQKNFLGKVNATKKYTVLLYLSSMAKDDAHGFGALEHPTATTVVLPESMPKEKLVESMKDVVSHEFFHIVTPLTVHSKEIQYFDYNAPKMSEHLWMYEGVTEYFANLFQINQGLIAENEFYTRIAEKIEEAKALNDTMSFTKMSANVLVQPYKDQYLNVYQKGALIGMCIDIIIREKSNGERGILDLMHKLANEYGVEKPFNDNELFAKITELTYPEVGEFLNKYVAGTTPIPYDFYLAKVGVTKASEKVPASIFIKGQTPYIGIDPATKIISVRPDVDLNIFFTNLKLKAGDVITAVNGKTYNLENIYDLISESEIWKENDPITIKIKRDGKEQTIKGTVKVPFEEKETFKATDTSKEKLKNAWLKG
ncbi:peptidase M61 [Flavobacterium aquidurense]|jgi:predicted metalloprotease with PDZ domain|uniref:M61 family metallopeptidase n=1 Tax=Flavobacterium aquidurense TaxID=362413 RepID=UPI00091C131D|nr:peptidase M61 [Flavobacterium aquidurense]OXA72713.1 peptidase M61 [Flavobacterium aquidurense]SHG27918.1 Predicted metalloprotease, contains C-terminal PDZ domain [Flavobacterium frigidimaris]